VYKITLLLGILTLTAYSQQMESVKESIYDNPIIHTDSSFFTETTEKRLGNYWGFHLGYFPNMNSELYVSSGIGFALNMENYNGSKLNWGWYFIFRKTFEDEGEGQKTGSASLGASLSYHFSNKYNTFLLKIGLGLRTPPYVHLSTLFVLEYQFQIFGGVLLSISLTEEIISFREFAPPLISLGIVL